MVYIVFNINYVCLRQLVSIISNPSHQGISFRAVVDIVQAGATSMSCAPYSSFYDAIINKEICSYIPQHLIAFIVCTFLVLVFFVVTISLGSTDPSTEEPKLKAVHLEALRCATVLMNDDKYVASTKATERATCAAV